MLTLNSSKEDVQGNYVCSAENSVGTDRDNVTVKVRRKMTLLQGFNGKTFVLLTVFWCQYENYFYCEIKSLINNEIIIRFIQECK